MRNHLQMSKKGQYAVPIILIAMVAMLVIYLILVYPDEQARILGITVPNASNKLNQSPLGGETKLVFSSGEISEIGRSAGESVFNFSLNNFYIAYPVEEKILDSKGIQFKTNVFSADSSNFDANNLNLESTKEVIVKLNVTELKGTPVIIIYLNESEIFQRTAVVGEVNVKIPSELLNETNPIKIRVEHNGAFWTGQSAKINIAIVQIFYNPKSPVVNQVVTLGQSNIRGNEMRLSFNPIEAVTEGELIVKTNNKIVFSGSVNTNETFTVSSRLDTSGIMVGDNTFSFEADKGGVYNLTNVTLEFIAVATPAATKTYSFDIEKADFASGRKIVLGLRVDKIIKPGFVYVQIGEGGPLYYFNNADLTSGVWSYTELDKRHLEEFGNKIIVNSPNGRYRVTGLAIILM